ncbi:MULTISPECIES: urease accessory protein UreE [Salinibaculum]|uniref:urease accessory protein UreE n=1 Tax=Salinibaculum TaxID=2732368 RepID=UPI0030D1F0F1
MQRVDGILGNVNDDAELSRSVAVHEKDGSLERVVIPAGDRHRSRLRVETDAGKDLGIVVDEPPLYAGDVLVLDDDRAVVVAFEDEEAVVIDLPEPSSEGVVTAVELGHRIGNLHWDLAIRDGAAYIPVAADRHIIENVLAESLPAGVEPRYEMVDASLWVGGTPDNGGTEHDHGADHSHDHEHTHSDDYRYAHSEGYDHAHGTSHSHGGDET